MLTYFQALKHEDDPKSCFVDLDSSTKTSTRQLKFLHEQQRLFEIDIYDNLKKIERENLLKFSMSWAQPALRKYSLILEHRKVSIYLPFLISISQSMNSKNLRHPLI